MKLRIPWQGRRSWLAAGVVWALLTLTRTAVAEDGPIRGVYSREPATRWEAALLAGNGRMGAIVFGQPLNETVVVNHCRMFLPLGSKEIVPNLAADRDKGREVAMKGGPEAFHNFVRQKCQELGWRSLVWTDPFHPACVLKLAMKDSPKERADYRASEDFHSGEVAVRWTNALGAWERKLFVSRPDNVMVWSIAGPKGAVSFDLGMEIQHALLRPEIRAEGSWLTAHAIYVKGKGGYDTAVRVVNRGGTIQSTGGHITVTGADGALVLIRVVPWKTPLPREQSEAWAYSAENPDFGEANVGVYRAAPGLGESSVVAYQTAEGANGLLPRMKASLEQVPADYAVLLPRHVKVHGEMFDRVSLDLGGGGDRQLAIEDLLARAAKENVLPPALMERMYDGCRYLAICSSGELVPNLQGIWTGTWSPAWSGDFTLDSNLQLAMNSMCSANLPEFMEPYGRLLDSWLPEMRINAREVYGGRGIVANTRASNTCLLLHTYDWVAELCISCGGWMGHYLYDSYRFTGDRDYLAKRTVPYLKEAALFYEDLLTGTEGPDGKYRFFISYSPEHGNSPNATIDIAVAREVLSNLVAACEELGVERDNLPKWRQMLAKMPAYVADGEGALQEWAWPGVKNSYNMRHHSGLYPLYQSFELSPEKTPELWKAARLHWQKKTEQWLRNPAADSNNITHGMADHAQCAARLGEGEVLHEVLTRLAARRYIFPSMMMSYWPGLNGFGFDPIGTIPEAVNNALVFAHDGTIDLLGALPQAWPRGELRGTLARGQIKIDRLAWDRAAGKVTLEMTSGKKQTVLLRLGSGRAIRSMTIRGAELAESGNEGPGRRIILEAGLPARLEIAF